MFEAGRVERRRQRGGHAGFVDITQLGADRTAPETEMLAGSEPMPRQPRPHKQVHLDSKKSRSKRQSVSPSWISSIPSPW